MKRHELLRARLQAERDGVTLLEFFAEQVLDHNISGGAISSHSHGSDTVSFFSPTANGLTLQDNSELRFQLYNICDAAVTTLGGSPTNSEVYAQMLEDDWFYGTSGYNVDLTDQAR